MKRILCLLVSSLFLLPHTLPAIMPTDQPLRRTESEHFIYIYQANLEKQIPKLVRDCEDAYALLTPIFQWQPRGKSIVLFSDGFDIHNGWATVFPRPTMMIYAADTPPGSTIYEPGDYIRRTVFHEFTHLLSMDPQFGLDGALTRVFGRMWPVMGDPLSLLLFVISIPPGAVAPTWFIEGLAMWTETEMVGPGRGRNSLVDMIMRSAAAEDQLLPPSQWNLRHPEWPFGNVAYIYGMKLIQYAHETYGLVDPERNVVGELSLAAARSTPYWFNQRARPVTGKFFTQLAHESLTHEQKRQRERIEQLAAKPFTPLARLTPNEIQVYHPRFDRTGKQVYFSGTREERRDALYVYDAERRSQTPRRLSGARADGSFSKLAPAPDRAHFYYTRLDSPRREMYRSQLYRYDALRNRARKVTGSGRYRFPTISPDHMRMAAVRAEAGQQVLVEVPIASAGRPHRERILAHAPPNTTLVDPVYAPDRRTLVYIQADERSSRLHRIDLASGADTVLLEWPSIITSPSFHPEGRELVFVSDKNGVYNLYRMHYRANARPVALTHVLGGVFDPDFSPDGRTLAVTAYDADGYYLSLLDYRTVYRGVDSLPALEPAWTPLAVNEQRRIDLEERSQPQTAPNTRPYRPLLAIRPNFWSPWLGASIDGVQGGLLTELSDPVERHYILAIAGYESEHGTPIGALVYQYERFEPILTLYGFHNQNQYGSLVRNADDVFYDYDEEIGGAGATITFPMARVDRSVFLTLGYQWSQSKSIRKTAERFADAELVTDPIFTGDETAAWAELQYFSATAFRRSHSLEDGRYLSAAVERSDEALGGDLNRTRALGAWHEYIRMPWGKNHVLKLEGHYGTSDGDRTAQSAFGLGGYFDTIAVATPGVPRSLGLRGYDDNTQVGTDIVKAGAAYRFPIARLYRGGATAPFYMHQVFGEIFYEGGRATGGEPEGQSKNEWVNAFGFELNFGLTVLRWMDLAPGIGFVYAADRTSREHDEDGTEDGDKFQVYVSIKSTVNF